MRRLNVAMIGFGNAGRAFSRIILEKQKEIEKTMDCDIRIVAITTGRRGSFLCEEGIDLEEACRQIEEEGAFRTDSPQYSKLTSTEVIRSVEYDVMLELTPLQIFTGQPAIDHIKAAMQRKKHVVTANKGPIAWAYKELREMAEEKGVCFYYETTVMDGTPIFNLTVDTLKFCKVTEVSGILNTTTNFVLEELAKGASYEEAMQEGRKRGFVEADPSMDMDGWDAAAKTTALLNVLMHADITPRDIDRTGITAITEKDIKEAKRRGCFIKLFCRGVIEDGKVVGTVKPIEVPEQELIAHIDGTSSAVSITTDLMGKLTIVEHNPEILQTGYGIFSDLIRVIDHSK
ncbi:homoserine dehydrogenase [Sinanaerobacter sp. ZZT-01]|uniref:homoserine dehydrogenase n=1 Tax=Sinanaerobacter sp. ZZT-01 TaxID=3111540 RepID=UPI002D79F402|nr:homoserine dehydrogenase [Sinanaerobacter sp. ZZT-01]WRR94432.1 homoserine dehydrogenase [Sinanaerobacter sp. ZZT-01]